MARTGPPKIRIRMRTAISFVRKLELRIKVKATIRCITMILIFKSRPFKLEFWPRVVIHRIKTSSPDSGTSLSWIKPCWNMPWISILNSSIFRQTRSYQKS